MGLTSIAGQLTPGSPEQITFAAPQGLPNPQQTLLLIGHMNASGVSGGVSGSSGTMSATGAYVLVQMANVGDPVAASGEASGYFGIGSELAKMVVAAVAANQLSGNFPPIKCVPLLSTDTGWGNAMATIDKTPAEYVVSCYDGMSQALMQTLLTETAAMSAPQRVDNGQYGTLGVAVNRNVTAPSGLFKYDTIYGSFHWLRDTGAGAQAPVLTLGEEAAAIAAQMAANQIPFPPLRNQIIPNIPAPAQQSDWISVGAGMESEACLQQGWCPVRVLPNGSVAHVRTRTLRVTVGDGVTPVTAYYDVQDFNVLFFWRKTLATRFAQADIAQAKASQQEGQLILSEVIRLARLFETQGMFQAMDLLAKLFQVQRNVADRARFDVFTPVNVVPILSLITTNIQATTVGDTLTF